MADQLTVAELDPEKKYVFFFSPKMTAYATEKAIEAIDKWQSGDSKYLAISAEVKFISPVPFNDQGEDNQ